jgi:hypothetical protein
MDLASFNQQHSLLFNKTGWFLDAAVKATTSDAF